ncbi:hypothetical protein F3N42_03655 [Marinihelvus fidelis]|uniref:DUF3168 domain-containing protein n=1 Tax=Marinihelvus fidelis TaxID=2613842 RepID=A0A5N0TG56_9GAMM|nr:hypothetical protein [Marinihelvus fidelis]KAA9133458.1 hypothetical protein F3N42_03655 [Marinihelvus fidelis]
MSHVNAFVSRITSEALAFATVRKAWTTKPISDFKAQLPAALVYLAGVDSDENGLDTGFRQEQTISIGVLIVCDADDLEARRAELETALCGWEPAAGDDLVEHESAAVVEIEGGIAWWRETYSFRSWKEI